MPKIELRGRQLNYEVAGPTAGPSLTFGHGQILDLRSWAPQAAAFSDRYRVQRLDFRGHGQSGLGPDPHQIEDLADDVIALLDESNVASTHFVGSSLGGMVGFALALNHPERLNSLTLLATQGQLPAASAERLRGMIVLARQQGPTMAPQVADMFARYMTADYAAANPAEYAKLCEMAAETTVEGFARSSEAIIAMDYDGRLAEIRTPTLVVAGEHDMPTPPERMTLYRDGIAGAKMAVVEDAGHFPNYDQPDRFNKILSDFLGSLE